jgi:hypothetical protein
MKPGIAAQVDMPVGQTSAVGVGHAATGNPVFPTANSQQPTANSQQPTPNS